MGLFLAILADFLEKLVRVVGEVIFNESIVVMAVSLPVTVLGIAFPHISFHALNHIHLHFDWITE